MKKIEQAQRFMEKINAVLYKDKMWMVGGAVRDIILGIEPSDIDFASSFAPSEIVDSLKLAGIYNRDIDKKDAALGIVRVKFEDTEYEIATFRNEIYTEGSRKPVVEFTQSIHADSQRRDFNINSIYWDGSSSGHIDSFYDPFGAIECDYEGNITGLTKNILTNKHPEDSFGEDPLRVLRYLRFNKLYGDPVFEEIDIYDHVQDIVSLSPQKARQEIEKGFKIPGMYKVYWETDVLKLLIPYYVSGSYIRNYNFSHEGDPISNWAYLMMEHVVRSNFSQENNVTLVEKALRVMNFSKEEIKAISLKVFQPNEYLRDDWKPKPPIERLFGGKLNYGT